MRLKRAKRARSVGATAGRAPILSVIIGETARPGIFVRRRQNVSRETLTVTSTYHKWVIGNTGADATIAAGAAHAARSVRARSATARFFARPRSRLPSLR